MEDSFLQSENTVMDTEFMDGLLLDGCWLETTDGSEFLNLTPPTPFDPSSFMWSPPQDTSAICTSGVVSQTYGQDDDFQWNKRWWIGPGGGGSSVTERLVQAVEHIKDYTTERGSLIQLWVPVNRGGKRVLTTKEQPFSHDPMCQRLANYREISVNYHFSAEQDDSKALAGLPGRVFLGKLPEWTPDVRFFKSEEYPRVQHAQDCDVRGTLAIPVFEQGSKICLGVIEVVMTTEMAVDLRSTELPIPPSLKVSKRNYRCDLSYKAALPEIRNLLRCACETHKLPLAQTWVSCPQQSKSGCRHNDENYIHCVSTIDDACYLGDPTVREFHEACSEHHLLKGQGVAGQAFLTNGPCFSPDVSNYKKSDDRKEEIVTPKIENNTPELHHQSLGMVFDGGDKTHDGFGLKRGFDYTRDSNINESSTFTSGGFNSMAEKKRTKADKTITLDVLRQYFAGRICRQHGIQRWPSRKIKKVGHSLQKIQRVIDSVEGVSGPLPIGSFYANFPNLASQEPPQQAKASPPPPPPPLPQPPLQLSKSPVSQYSHSSSSSQCSHPSQPDTFKKVSSEIDLQCSSLDQTVLTLSSLENIPHGTNLLSSSSQDDDSLRIKVSYGEEKIRFRMKNSRRLSDLLWEIGKRFSIEDMSRYDLKYLDEDNEWVLLTCDEDVEECVDVCRTTPSHTIKLLLHASSHHFPERSSPTGYTLWQSL
ncbi:hypothetical protein Bca52824_032062 [Brassica carinata]|uniref:Uncharacterized protein n=1 Tax=Brassica carinata TaxID=52824 RepID=A0A8X7V8A9_BRACI|nr:hypothetical protein Bca52824_032062 [Brassica carinata]